MISQSNWVPEFSQSLLITLISLSIIGASSITIINRFSLDRAIGNLDKKTILISCNRPSPSESSPSTTLEKQQLTDTLASHPYPGKKTSGIGR